MEFLQSITANHLIVIACIALFIAIFVYLIRKDSNGSSIDDQRQTEREIYNSAIDDALRALAEKSHSLGNSYSICVEIIRKLKKR